MQETLLTTAEAAQVLGLHEKTITRWCREKRLDGAHLHLRSRKLGWRIPARSIAHLWYEEHMHATPQRLP